jgi:hypothetical protein
MTRFKYPAPFDPPDPGPIQVEGAPLPPSPPLPVNIPGQPLPVMKNPSLYRDLFGDDLAPAHLALQDSWANHDQRLLAEQLLDGRKSINSLTEDDRELLDSLASSYAMAGDQRANLQQADDQRLSLLGEEDPVAENDEDLQAEEGSDLQHRLGDEITGAYGWTGKESSE